MFLHPYIILGFGSLVLILGMLSILKVRMFKYVAGSFVGWCLVGSAGIFGFYYGGEKSMLPPPTRAEIQAYEASPFYRLTLRVWVTGLVIGLPLLAMTWAREHKHLSRSGRFMCYLISITAFLVGLWTLIK